MSKNENVIVKGDYGMKKATPAKKQKKSSHKASSNSQPWYGVKLLYQHLRPVASSNVYEERVLIVIAASFEKAIAKAEKLSKKTYESETIKSLSENRTLVVPASVF